jgi:hypothetical protein
MTNLAMWGDGWPGFAVGARRATVASERPALQRGSSGARRLAAMTVPGALPSRINYVKLAESRRPLADIIDGGSQDDYVSARTAFQVVYPS